MYQGDWALGSTHDFTFTTVNTSGVPTQLAGAPAVISVYKQNSTTQTTAGVTLTVDFDTVTGLNHVRIVTTDAFYVAAADYSVVITTGTVGGSSVVGYTVATFSIENRSDRKALGEPAGIFAWSTANIYTVAAWLGTLGRNKITQTSTTQTVRNDADNASLATATISDDGTTFTRGEFT